MKYISVAVLMLVQSGSSALAIPQTLQRGGSAPKQPELLSIGEKVLTRPNLVNLMADVNQWDGDILGLIDKSYTRQTALADKEQNVNIEFSKTPKEQQKNILDLEKYLSENAKKTQSPQSVIQQALQEQKKKSFQKRRSEVLNRQKQKQDAEKRVMIEQLEKQKNKALAQLELEKDKKMKVIAVKKMKMNQEWDSFCKTLRMAHWENAQEIWSKLEDIGFPQQILKANTKELFQKNFKFDQIASNDDTVAILQDLDIAENNLNQNPDNKILLNKYISTAQEAGKELRSKFPDFWTDPGEALVQQESSSKKKSDDDDDEDEKKDEDEDQ